MCFKRKKEVDYIALSRELEKQTFDKYYAFIDYLKNNENYNFLISTKWFIDIDNDCYHPLSMINFKIWNHIGTEENMYNEIKETCEKVSGRLMAAKVSIPDVIKKMKENSEAFKKFCEETYARFFVLEPLFGGPNVYCFSCEKEMFPDKLKADANGYYFLNITMTNTLRDSCYVEEIFSTDYSIRSMYDFEFRDTFLPIRSEKIGFKDETELLKYQSELGNLYIYDTITVKNNGK